jgi:hypothetical protein
MNCWRPPGLRRRNEPIKSTAASLCPRSIWESVSNASDANCRLAARKVGWASLPNSVKFLSLGQIQREEPLAAAPRVAP